MAFKLTSLMGNSQMLDGGAMFGNVPKALWSRWSKVDTNNRIPLACRCLLIQTDNRNILLETGIGAFFEPKLRERYGVVEEEHVLAESLSRIGLKPTDIDTIVLSHLHFDHAGGLLKPYQTGSEPSLLFESARIVTSKRAWERALDPHPRDRASFIPGLTKMLDNDRLILIEDSEHNAALPKAFSFRFSEGHTPGMMLTKISGTTSSIVFGADLVPGTAWVHLPVTMGYDRNPEVVVNEKETLMNDLATSKTYLFYTHDPDVACSQIEQEGGKFKPTNNKPVVENWAI